MNRKQLLILLVVVVILGAFGWMRYRRSESSWQSGGPSGSKKLFSDLPVNDIASIIIKGGTNDLELVRKDGLWRVKQRNDYPANFAAISSFLLKAADLKAVQVEEVEPSQLSRYKLLPAGASTNTAIEVDMRDQNGKSLGHLLLGKNHMHKGQARPSPMGEPDEAEGYPDGRYVMTSPDSKFVAIISEPFSDFGTKPEPWLNKDFIKVARIRSIAVNFPVATNSWKLTRDNDTSNEWKLGDAKAGEKLDASKASGFSYALNAPTFTDALTADTKPQPAGLDKPTLITIDTFDDFTYAIKVGQKTNDDLPIMVTVGAELPKERVVGKDEKAEDKARLDKEFADKQKELTEKLAREKAYEKWIYIVTPWTLDSFLKERHQLLSEKKEGQSSTTATPGSPSSGENSPILLPGQQK